MKKTLRCLGVGSVLAVATSAWADPIDGLTFEAGLGMSHDNNIFRSPSGTEVADDIRSASVGLKLDKSISLQKFNVDATLTDYNYADNTDLDYRGKDFKAGWDWNITPSLYGNLSASLNESLVNFADYVAETPEQRRNIRSTKGSRFNAEWEVNSPIHLLGGVSHTDVTNSQDFLEEDNYSADSYELGVKFVSLQNNSIAFVHRGTNGTFDRAPSLSNRRDSGFEQTDNELRIVWNPTGKTNVIGRAGYIEREHDHFHVRDFDGWVGNVDAMWSATEKLGIGASVKRSLNSYQEDFSRTVTYSDYYVSNLISVGPIWRLTEKTQIGARFGVEDRDYQGAKAAGGGPLRDDRLKQIQLTVDWQPLKSLGVNAGWYHYSRESNVDTSDFSSDMYTLSVNLQL